MNNTFCLHSFSDHDAHGQGEEHCGSDHLGEQVGNSPCREPELCVWLSRPTNRKKVEQPPHWRLHRKRENAEQARLCTGHTPDEPQSQQMSFPGSRCTSSMMALVRSSRLFSPVLCSPRKAMVRASSLLFVSTDIHLWSRHQRKVAFTRAWPPLSSSIGNLPSICTFNPPPPKRRQQ